MQKREILFRGKRVDNGDNCSCDCDCEVLILNIVAIQAAELRERLKYYEGKEEAEQQGDCETRR